MSALSREKAVFMQRRLQQLRALGELPAQQVDEIAVERAIMGAPPARMTIAERVEVTRILTHRGKSAAEIARLLGVTKRTVFRQRARLKAAS